MSSKLNTFGLTLTIWYEIRLWNIKHFKKLSTNNDFDANQETLPLKEDDQQNLSSTKSIDQDTENQAVSTLHFICYKLLACA